MGEAKRRSARHKLDNDDAAMVDRDKLARALRITLEPIAEEIGMIAADCLLYASVGAETLRCLGMPAQLRTGDAAWRVGQGDGDVIHNAASAGGTTFAPASIRSTVFHAWIVIMPSGATPAQLVDFTTWQLRQKAAWIDSADGGHTNVEFCPDYLWVPESRARALTLRQVGNSFDVGVYHYATRPIPAGLVQPSAAAIKNMSEVVMCRYGELSAK